VFREPRFRYTEAWLPKLKVTEYAMKFSVTSTPAGCAASTGRYFLATVVAFAFFFFYNSSATAAVDLYTWKEADGHVAYSIVMSGAHGKKMPEIAKSKITSLKALEAKLKNLREGTQVNWNDMVATGISGDEKAKFVLPDATAYNSIRSTAARAHLKLTIAR
jgi:hypothetical protein